MERPDFDFSNAWRQMSPSAKWGYATDAIHDNLWNLGIRGAIYGGLGYSAFAGGSVAAGVGLAALLGTDIYRFMKGRRAAGEVVGGGPGNTEPSKFAVMAGKGAKGLGGLLFGAITAPPTFAALGAASFLRGATGIKGAGHAAFSVGSAAAFGGRLVGQAWQNIRSVESMARKGLAGGAWLPYWKSTELPFIQRIAPSGVFAHRLLATAPLLFTGGVVAELFGKGTPAPSLVFDGKGFRSLHDLGTGGDYGQSLIPGNDVGRAARMAFVHMM